MRWQPAQSRRRAWRWIPTPTLPLTLTPNPGPKPNLPTQALIGSQGHVPYLSPPGTEWQPTAAEHIDDDNLPQALGGKHMPKGPPAFGFL